MGPKPLLAAIAALTALTIAPSAAAVGLGERQQVAAPHARAAHAAVGLIAPAVACPGQDRLDAPAQAQKRAMRCMTDFARERAGLPGLATTEQLESSARGKSGDVLRCDDFSHFACGREFTYWMDEFGYLSVGCWRVGENLAWGIGEDGTVGSIFRAWMRSAGHRQNILSDFSQIGVDLREGTLGGLTATHVWTQHFGSHCEATEPQS